MITNGFPLVADHALEEGDEITFIQRGEIPSREEMECLLMARHTPGVHQKVKESVVGIAGIGGLGSGQHSVKNSVGGRNTIVRSTCAP
jgi:sulfur carrier protein ThiS adenylyltransferase